MSRINTCLSFVVLTCVFSLVGFAVDGASESIQSTTIEAITVDGNLVVSVKTKDVRITARSLTIDGIGGTQTITASPEGIELKNDHTWLTVGGKMELRSQLTITKMDLIRLEIVPQKN